MRETALIISATAPVPVDNGKRVVLSGLLEYLVERLGPDHTHYALIGEPNDAVPDFPGVRHHLDRPGTVAQLRTIARRMPFDRACSVQEAMLGTPALRRQIHDLVARLQPDIEIYDTLRLGQHAPCRPRGRRRILYMDDLFSVRYDRLLDVDEAHDDLDINPLGEFAANVPAPMRWVIQHRSVYRPVLRMERDRIRRAETRIVDGFDVNLLVNSDEVDRLRKSTGSSTIQVVHGRLPAVPQVERDPVDPPELAFIGRLNIPHNDDAICAFIRAAMPELIRRHPGLRLRVIGRDPSDALTALARDHAPHVALEGFVPDLETVLRRATATVAPLRFGSGVKIKMLDALARGVPTLATTVSVEGIAVSGNGSEGCLVSDDLSAWPDLVEHVLDPRRNAEMSAAATRFFRRIYAADVVTAQYDNIFGLHPVVTAVDPSE